MVFPISFSSFGDIVTAADLAIRIAKALSSSAGSSFEYQYLIEELNSLAYALQLADAATRTGMLKQDVVNGILAEIVRCRVVMDALWERIRGYQKALGSKRGSSSSGSSWRKIGWALFKKEDVQETRMKLTIHRTNLITLMTACNLSSLEDLKKQSNRFEQHVRLRLNEIYTVISHLPAKLCHSRANAVSLRDWRGVETLIPLDLCQTREQFEATMNAVAYKWPTFVQQHFRSVGAYLICDETNYVLEGCDDHTFTSHLAGGNTIRATAVIVNHYSDSWADVLLKLPYHVRYLYCVECQHGGRSQLYDEYYMFKDGLNMIHIGCDPALARYMATVKESTEDETGLVEHIYTLHDPSYSGCAVSHLGVSISTLAFANEGDPFWSFGDTSNRVRVQRGRAFPYLTF